MSKLLIGLLVAGLGAFLVLAIRSLARDKDIRDNDELWPAVVLVSVVLLGVVVVIAQSA